MKKSLLIIGAGGHGKVVREAALSMRLKDEAIYDKIDFLDDSAIEAVGRICDLQTVGKQYDDIFVAIGDNELRKELMNSIDKMGYTVPTIIHHAAYVSSTTIVERGAIIEANVAINENCIVKQGCIISIGTVIDHNSIVEEFSHVNTGTICCAGSVILSGTKTAAGEIVKGY